MKIQELEEFIKKIEIISDILKTRPDKEVYELEVLRGDYCFVCVTKEYDNQLVREKSRLCFNELFLRYDYDWRSDRVYNYFFVDYEFPCMAFKNDFYYYVDSKILKLETSIWAIDFIHEPSFPFQYFQVDLNKNRYLLMKYVLYLKYTYPNYLNQLDNFILREV